MHERDETACADHGNTLLLSAGELSVTDLVAAARHLGECAACRELLATLDTVQTAFAAAAPPVPSEPFEVALTRITRENDGPFASWRSRVGTAPRWLGWAAGLVIGAGLFGAGVYAGRGGSPDDLPATEGGGHAAAVALSRAELRSEVWTDRLRGTQRLGAVGVDATDDVVQLLSAVIASDPNPNVRLAALDALRSQNRAAVPLAVVEGLLLTEPLAVLRIELVDLLASHGGAGAADLLRRLMVHERDPAVRRRAALALETTS